MNDCSAAKRKLLPIHVQTRVLPNDDEAKYIYFPVRF